MKFGKQYTLQTSHFQSNYKAYFLPYKYLKKCLKTNNKLECLAVSEMELYKFISLVNLFLKGCFTDVNIRLKTLLNNLKQTLEGYDKDAKICLELLHKYEIFFINFLSKPTQFDFKNDNLLFLEFEDLSNLGKQLIKRKQLRETVLNFLQFNLNLLNLYKFYQLNKLALHKILKKYTKSGHIMNKHKYTLIQLNNPLNQTVEEFVSFIPKKQDYCCCVCQELLFEPVKLDCLHELCLSCYKECSVNYVKNCPICRSENVFMKKIDKDKKLHHKLKIYFPKEMRLRKICDELNTYNTQFKKPIKKKIVGECNPV